MVAAHQEWLAANRRFGLPPMDASGVLIPVFGFEAFCDEAIALRAVAIPHVGELKADHAARQEQDRDAVVVDNEARRLTGFANPGPHGRIAHNSTSMDITATDSSSPLHTMTE